MEKFAIITFPDGGDRIVNQSKILGKLPKKIMELYKSIRGPRLVDIIKDGQSGVELGNIYNIPTLHYNKEGFIFDDRERQIKLLIKELHTNRISILSAPFIRDIFTSEDIALLNRYGIQILDANFYHAITLYSCIPNLLKILSRRLPYMEVGIWGGDTDLGEAWIHMLAPYCNRMTIGGDNIDRLYKLSSKILKKTGLSCEITQSIQSCIGGKCLSISTERIDNSIDRGEISIISYPFDIKDIAMLKEELLFCSGFLELSCQPTIDINLNIWEHLALSNSILYILHDSYRKLVDEDRLDMFSLDTFIKMMKLYPLKAKGLVNSSDTITYDRFRMIYFKDDSDKMKVG